MHISIGMHVKAPLYLLFNQYLTTSNGTYRLLRPWIPQFSALIIIAHLGFSLMNILQGESEAIAFRSFAIVVMLPYAFCSAIESRLSTSLMRNSFLLAIFSTGPMFSLLGVFNELSQKEVDVVVVVRREFEFLASFGVFLLASSNMFVALVVGTLLSAIVSIIAVLYVPVDWAIVQPTWVILMSGYIVVYIALALIARKRNTQAESRAEMSKSIGSSIAHELRTPLLSIRTKAESLDQTVPKLLQKHGHQEITNQRQFELLKKTPRSLVEEAESAMTLIDILLMNVSRSEDQISSNSKVNIGNALAEAIQRYPYRSERERRAIDCGTLPDAWVRGSKILLVHIIFNLFKNSFEHVHDSRTLKIFISSTINEDHIKLIIADNGPGIPKEEIEKIFEPFVTNSKFGTGIGLAFCKSAMKSEFMGNIKCESQEGDLTKMILEFPIEIDSTNKS